FEHYGADDDVKSRLEAIDRDPGKVDYIVNSHLHFDHAGGNELIPNATMVVQKRECQAAQDPETAAKVGFFKADFDHGHQVKQVDGEHDLFGDGSVICIPTYGHKPGCHGMQTWRAGCRPSARAGWYFPSVCLTACRKCRPRLRLRMVKRSLAKRGPVGRSSWSD